MRWRIWHDYCLSSVLPRKKSIIICDMKASWYPNASRFTSVSLFFILVGACIVSLSCAKLFLNVFSGYGYSGLSTQFIGGLLVTCGGYIHLELTCRKVATTSN